jgi:hypothetical protein
MEAGKRKRLLELATRSPTSDNSQPFFFKWMGDHLLIFHDDERAKRRGNTGNFASFVALGCLMASIDIAASGESLKPDFRLTLDPDEHMTPWVEVSFTESNRPEEPLLPGLAIRCSDRRLYRGGDLSHPVFDSIRADLGQIEGCQLYFQDKPDTALIDYILECEEFLWRDQYVMRDVLKWVRWSDREAEETRDGVIWRGLAIPFILSRVMKLAYHYEKFRNFLRRSGAPMRSQRQVGAKQIESSAALACFSVKDTRPESLVAVGRAFLRTWVRLNQAGFGVQVMANPSLHVFQHAAGILPKDYPESSIQTFAKGREALPDSFGFGPDEIPAWMFRTGISSELPANWRTFRRRLSDVVLESDEQAG